LIECRIRLGYFGDLNEDPSRLYGVAEHPERGQWFCTTYGLHPQATVPELSAATWDRPTPWVRERALQFQEFQELWQKLEVGWKNVPGLDKRLAAEA
jgi:hypothetical protein